MGNRYRLISLLIVLAASTVASTGPALGLTIEDFEGYASTAELVAAWVPSSNVTETLEQTIVFEGQKSMTIEYFCNQGDCWTLFTYGVEQNWTSFTTFSLMYLGAPGNSAENLVVEIRDLWGNFIKGAAAVNATQASVWTEYSMDISGWANREWVKEIKIWVEASSWGTGVLHVDYLLLPSAISVGADTWSRIKSMYANER